ncbi:MAG: hypothetical protein ACR2PK_00070 [Acidimicrobiales bacterium]
MVKVHQTTGIGAPMFVHDFVAVGRPVDSTVIRFSSLLDSHLASMVRHSWNANAPVVCATADKAVHNVSAGTVQVERRGQHLRQDALITNVRWSGDGWLPALDADLEVVAFGSECTHLHLMGRYELPAEIDRFSPLGSLVQRAMVMAVRGFLIGLGDELEA